MNYTITNQPFTVLSFQLNQGESIKYQSGAMAWMSPSIQMETKLVSLTSFHAATFQNMFVEEYQAASEKMPLLPRPTSRQVDRTCGAGVRCIFIIMKNHLAN